MFEYVFILEIDLTQLNKKRLSKKNKEIDFTEKKLISIVRNVFHL